MQEVFGAVKFMHDNDIVHRDLKVKKINNTWYQWSFVNTPMFIIVICCNIYVQFAFQKFNGLVYFHQNVFELSQV